MGVEILSSIRVGCAEGGVLHRCKHASSSTRTDMTFSLFLPSCHKANTSNGKPTPLLYWLSGLTCTDENFPTKAGCRAFYRAEKENIAIVMPDTSPRGEDVPNDDGYDLGVGAGFYVNATEEPWKKNFQMYDYVTKELPILLENKFDKLGSDGLKSITGHSMGGHGALTIAFKNQIEWVSVSAFSPICNPTMVKWGIKAFNAYLGDVERGKVHDATCLLTGPTAYDDILIEQGTDDQFLAEQLSTDTFAKHAKDVGQKVTINMREGFDHSYHFIGAFIEDHVSFHGHRLRADRKSVV